MQDGNLSTYSYRVVVRINELCMVKCLVYKKGLIKNNCGCGDDDDEKDTPADHDKGEGESERKWQCACG